ncbi:uncharacterized protein [Musca autumnalis]|uniref:uncharacterized protein n=1 Tax=Musca autumnalis TaxID=221902 RepID=UPI003CE91081
MGCFSCFSKRNKNCEPMQYTIESESLSSESEADLKAADNNVSSEQQPLNQTKVKSSKSGNTIKNSRPNTPEISILSNEETSASPSTKTKAKKVRNDKTVTTNSSNSNVINKATTTPKTNNSVVAGEQQPQEPNQNDQNEGVYRSTVAPMSPKTTQRKRFNLKSMLNIVPKREVVNLRQSVDDIYFIEQRCLNIHNRLRALHGAKPLTLNSKMSDYAMEWANELAKKNKLKHRKWNKFGENLAMGSGSTYTVEDAVQSWYDEMKNFDYENPTISDNTCRFTQVVWGESTQLGVGVAQNDNMTFIVCNYNPRGNVKGQYKSQVPPLGGFKNDCPDGNTTSGTNETHSTSNKKSGFYSNWFKSKK